jgi:hypothetical protein
MPYSLGPDESDDVIALINRTADDVNAAMEAFDDAELTEAHVEALARAQHNAVWLMAYYTDGLGFGVLDEETIDILWDYSELACDLMERIMANSSIDLTPKRLEPGRYLLTRRLTDTQPMIETSVKCTNPAVGLLQLDAWEQKCRASLAENAIRRAQKAKAEAKAA